MPSPPLLAAEGAEEVRERADARQGERQIEAMILWHADLAGARAEVELLVLDRDPAALRVVVRDDVLVQEVLVLHVEVERVAAAEGVPRLADHGRRVQVVRDDDGL